MLIADQNNKILTPEESKVVNAVNIANNALSDLRFAPDGTMKPIGVEQMRAETLDSSYIMEQFGADLGQRAINDIEGIKQSRDAVAKGNPANVPERYANATAAMEEDKRLLLNMMHRMLLPLEQPLTQTPTSNNNKPASLGA